MSKHRLWILAVTTCVSVAGLALAATGVTPGEEGLRNAQEEGMRSQEVVRSLLDVRVTDEDAARPAVTLDVDGYADYESLVLEDPDRLVIDMQGVVSRLDTHTFHVGNAGVVRVRAGQYRATPVPVARIVFDLENPVDYDVARDEDGRVVVRFGADSTDATDVVASADTLDAVESEVAVDIADAAIETADEAEVVDIVETEGVATDDTIEIAAVADVVETTDAFDTFDAADEAAGTADAADVDAIVAWAEPTPSFEQPVVASPDDAAALATDHTVEDTRAATREAIDAVLDDTTELAAPAATPSPSVTTMSTPMRLAPAQITTTDDSFSTKKIVTDAQIYSGKRISLNLVDADIKQLFRLFHDVSGLNFVLDPSVDGRVTVVLDQVPWDQALDLVLKNNGLDKILENNVIRIAPTQKLAAEAAQRKALKEAKELEVEPITITRTLSYAKADEVESVIRDGGILSPRGKVIVDERTNTLIISDIPKKVEPLDTLISTLDTETPQVMIEARIVETSRDFTQDLGVVWGFNAIADASRGTQTGLTFPNNASVRYGLNLPGDGAASNLAFKFGNIVDSFTLDVALNTLETEGRGRILSSPKIATQNNERAEIEQGVRIPVVNTTATEINVEFVSASLRLEVTPQITAEGTIILDVVVENNNPDFVNTVGDVPPINTQRAQTKVLISDGGTTVIGGIFTINEGRSEAGVPWFRKLPGLGWLFKTTNVTQQNRELLIFITPRILKIG